MTPCHAAPERISIFIPDLNAGGAQRVAVGLANGFARRGIRTTLLIGNGDGPFRDNVNQAVIVEDFRSTTLASVGKIRRHLQRERPQVLLSLMTHANIAAIIATRLSLVSTALVISERISLQEPIVTRRDRMLRRLMPMLYPRADAIVTVAEQIRSELVAEIGLDPEKIVAIANPVVDVEFRDAIDRARSAITAAADHPAPTKVILGVGRLYPQKDFTTLLQAFALVAQHRQDARLIIAGEGPERAQLISLGQRLGIGTRITLPGFVTDPAQLMTQADVFVLSSRAEGLPGVLIQAMACGARVVSTDCPTGPREILENGRWGRLVPVGDASAMAEAILAALDDADAPDVRARAADYSEQASVAAYLALFQRLLRPSSTA